MKLTLVETGRLIGCGEKKAKEDGKEIESENAGGTDVAGQEEK